MSILDRLLRRKEEDPKFFDRKMQDKLSIYKCQNCETNSKAGHAMPYLFHKVGRGSKCPTCGSSMIQKISISAVIELRWNKSVKQQLLALRGRVDD